MGRGVSLIGTRPRSVTDLPPRPPVRLPHDGWCLYCLEDLKTDTIARLHFCNARIAKERGYLPWGRSDSRVRA
jgi:hypothetical protein